MRRNKFGLELLGTLPDDPTVAQFDVVGQPIIEVGEDTPIFRAVAKIAGEFDASASTTDSLSAPKILT